MAARNSTIAMQLKQALELRLKASQVSPLTPHHFPRVQNAMTNIRSLLAMKNEKNNEAANQRIEYGDNRLRNMASMNILPHLSLSLEITYVIQSTNVDDVNTHENDDSNGPRQSNVLHIPPNSLSNASFHECFVYTFQVYFASFRHRRRRC